MPNINKTKDTVDKRSELLDAKIKKLEDDLIVLKKTIGKSKISSGKTKD